MYRTLAPLVLTILLLSMPLAVCRGGALVAHWPLDETAGTVAADSSGNGFDGTIGGTPNWVPGTLGGALELDGTSNFIDVNKEIIRGNCSLALWIRARDLPYSSGYRAILHNDQWNAGSLHGHLRATTTLFNFDVNGGGGVTSTTAAEPDEWYHLTGTFDVEAAESSIYVNGAQEATASGLSGSLYVGPLNWGAWTDSERFFPGAMDDIRIYDRVLTEPQIQELMDGEELAFVKAEKPDPEDGATAVGVALLQWSKGETAMFHDVYLGRDPNLTEADRVATGQFATLYFHPAGLEPGATYYWRVDEVEADLTTVHTGDVWTFVAQDLKAYLPDPADGAADVPLVPDLMWLPGRNITGHHVYFSDNFADVNEAAPSADRGEVEDPNFAPGELERLTTYYWRVDESALDGVRVGSVWTFSTYAVVEDFESYDEDMDAGTAVFQTWLDGVENGTGSLVGYLESANGTFNETMIVHGGVQAMPLDYNNVNPPHYSLAERTWSTAQDWTAEEAANLVLYVYGSRNNDVAPLLVRIEDRSGQSATLAHPDPEVVRQPVWTTWVIPFTDLTEAGVDPGAIEKMSISVGDPDNPVEGGTGLIYIDDIVRTAAGVIE